MSGAFDWLTGSQDTTTGSTATDSKTNTTTIGTNTQGGTQATANTSKGTSDTSQQQQQQQSQQQQQAFSQSSIASGRTLSDAEIATLDQAAGSIAGDKAGVLGTANDATTLAKQLVTRAGGEGDVYKQLAASASEAAKNTYANQTLADINTRTDKFGSSDSSLDALLHDQGNRNLDVQLAQIADQVGVTGQQAQSKDLIDALSGLIAGGGLAASGSASASSALSALLNTAKGGVTSSDLTTSGSSSSATTGSTTASGSSSTANTQNMLNTLITQLTTNQATQQNADTNNTATTTGTTTKSGSPLDIFKTIASFV